MRRLIASCALVAGLVSLASAQQGAAPAGTAQPAAQPAAAAAPATDAVAAPAAGGISVVRTIICTGVADREPVGAGEAFPVTIGTLTCFSEVKTDAAGEIQHKWYFNDKLIGNAIALKVSSPKWRTNSRKMIPEYMIGNWKVEVVDAASGAVLATANFKTQ